MFQSRRLKYVRFTILLLAALLHAQPDRFGLPACSGPDLELAFRPGFVLCYDFARKLPRWSAHEILPAPPPSRRLSFRQDPGLSRPTATHRDFTRSGFHRGHLTPAADLAASPAAYAASFLLSNVIPQPPTINNGLWRRLENSIRRLALEAETVIVITGTLSADPSPLTLGPGHVHVPTHTYKAVLTLAGAHKRMYAALVPNDPAAAPLPLASVMTSIDALELAAGLDFFAALDDAEEEALESACALTEPAALRRSQPFRENLPLPQPLLHKQHSPWTPSR